MSGPYPTYAYSYTVGRPLAATHRTSTSPTELTHLAIAFVVLTVDLVLILRYLAFLNGSLLLLTTLAASSALTGFLAHEMAHKLSAQRRGYWAEFRLSPFGLIISLLTAAAGFLFAAPGATMIGGMANPQDWGRTSLAGPVTNFAFGMVFFSASLVTAAIPAQAWLAPVLLFLAFINGWFAAFNMIPFGPLDGAKVLRWSRSTWAVSFVIFAAMAGLLYYLVTFGVVLRV